MTVTAALAASAVPDVVMTMEVAPKVRMGVNVVSPEENVPAERVWNVLFFENAGCRLLQ